MNAERDPDASAWERARQLQVEREQTARRAREERARAAHEAEAAAARAERTRARRSTVAWIAIVAGTVVVLALVMLAIANRASVDDEPVEAIADEAARLSPSPDAGSPSGTRRSRGSLDAVTPPSVDLTGDDLDQVWRQAQVLEGWLLRHPQPGYVDRIYAPGTETYAEVSAFIDDLTANGRAVVVEQYRIVDVEVVERPGPDQARLRYTDTYDTRDLVDVASGEVLDHEVSDGQVRAWTLWLQRAPSGAWQVTSIAPA